MAKEKPMKEKKEKTEDDKVETPEMALAKYLKANEEDHFDFTIPVDYTVSSGSLNLDMEIGGFRPGAHRVNGGPNLGKTPFVLNIVDNFLDTVPNSRVVWCKSEGRLSEENLARVRHPVVYNAKEWKTGTIYVFRCNIYETWIGMMRNLITNNPTDARYGFVTDSLDSLNLKNDMLKNIEEGNKIAGAPLLTKQMFQKIGLAMTERGHLKFFIGQRSADIKIDPYSKVAPRQTTGSGGNAAAHFANEVLELEEWYAGSRILENPKEKPDPATNRVLGHVLKITLRKSSKEKRFTTVEIPIRYGQVGGNSIWREREVADQMLTWTMISKEGAWLKVSDSLRSELQVIGLEIPEQINGINKLYSFLDENKTITDYLFNKFKSLMSGKPNVEVVK